MLLTAAHLSVSKETSQEEVKDALTAHQIGTILGKVLHSLLMEPETPLSFGFHQET